VIFITGFTVRPETVLEMDPVNSLSPPSSEHLFGTDRLGRDIQARAMRGAYRTLATAAIAAVVLVIPGGLLGGLAGYLAKRRTWQFESLADLLLLPFDILLFIPAIAAAVVFTLWIPEIGASGLGLLIALVLLPRAVRAAKTLWIAAPEYVSIALQVLGGFIALLLALFYAAFALTIAVDFIGIGIQPPAPSLGGMIADLGQFLIQTTSPMLLIIALILACSFPLYLAADSLISFFHSKKPQADLYE
jgi:peptide/nickel transport system permease protein